MELVSTLSRRFGQLDRDWMCAVLDDLGHEVDTCALDELFYGHDRVWRLSSFSCGDPDDAEDAILEGRHFVLCRLSSRCEQWRAVGEMA